MDELKKIKVGRYELVIMPLTADQVSASFGIAALSGYTPPTPPPGYTQEESIIGSPEFAAEYAAFTTALTRVEMYGFVALATDPEYAWLNYGEDSEAYKKTVEQESWINAYCERFGFVHDQRVPDRVIRGEKIVFFAEKSQRMYPDSVIELSNLVTECMKQIGFVGGSEIEAELKSETANDAGKTLAVTIDPSPVEAQDPVPEALPAA